MTLTVTPGRPRPVTSLAEVTIRPGSPDDTQAVKDMHQRCSHESLRRRFHAPLASVSTRMAHRLLCPATGWSTLAEVGAQVVGLMCADAVSDTDVEVGILVEDAHQGRGIGTRLLRDVARDAAGRGYERLALSCQPDNGGVMSLVRAAQLVGRATYDDGVVEVRISLQQRGQASRHRAV